MRVRIAHIRLHCMDLADVAKWLQMKRKIRTAYRDPDPPATLRQSTHHMPTDKARTVEHSYEPTCLHQFVRHRADPRYKAASLQSCVALECFDRKGNLESAAGPRPHLLDRRTPSMSPTSSFLPSGVAPMITSRHCAASSSRACTWM